MKTRMILLVAMLLSVGSALHAQEPVVGVKDPESLFSDKDPALNRNKYGRPTNVPAGFKPGDRVRTRNIHPVGHTRLPRYARGKTGTVEQVRGCHVYPDTIAAGEGENPQWLYTVVFDGRELWGEDSDPSLTVSIEAFEPYLEPA